MILPNEGVGFQFGKHYGPVVAKSLENIFGNWFLNFYKIRCF